MHDVLVPDIGDFHDVPVIDVLVKPGDHVEVEQPLVTLESDKATMDVPAPAAGTVREVKVRIGDRVSEGTAIVILDGAPGGGVASPKASVSPPPANAQSPSGIADVRVPDIGGFHDVPVIDILVKPGDAVDAEDPLVTLESDKATMDVPSPLSGIVRELRVKAGDKVSEGTIILTLTTADDALQSPASPATPQAERPEFAAAPAAPVAAYRQAAPAQAASASGSETKEAAFSLAYAGPGVRKLARERDVDLGSVSGSGRNGRILPADVEAYARRGAPSTPAREGGDTGAPATTTPRQALDLLAWPKVDFARFGPVEAKPLSRIRKISGANLARNWVMIPHVTNHDDADVTELEAFRVQLNREIEKQGVRVSMLAFLIKAACATLAKFPEFNASLDGDELILKKYCHIGFAADTPNGLVVPVMRDADRKGIVDIASEAGELATLARDGKLPADRMQGGTFTISSLGGIGGTYFTPIINAPEVAIMGVCRASWKQVSPDGTRAAWRLLLPLSLSYDHRVIDGAAAARFNRHFAGLLGDMRRVLL